MADAGLMLLTSLALTGFSCVGGLCDAAADGDVGALSHEALDTERFVADGPAQVRLAPLAWALDAPASLLEVPLDPMALLHGALPGPGTPLDAAPMGPVPAASTVPFADGSSPDDATPTGRGDEQGPSIPSLHVGRHDPGADERRSTQATVHAPPGDRGPTETMMAMLTTAAQRGAAYIAAAAAIGLYHRLTKERLLRHPSRQRILERLACDSAAGTVDIADELGCAYRTARHHLDMLHTFGLVSVHERAGRQVWTLPEHADRAKQRLSETEAQLVRALEDDPGLHLSALARRAGLAKTTTKHVVDRLVERGVVVEERTGPLRRFEPAENGRASPSPDAAGVEPS